MGAQEKTFEHGWQQVQNKVSARKCARVKLTELTRPIDPIARNRVKSRPEIASKFRPENSSCSYQTLPLILGNPQYEQTIIPLDVHTRRMGMPCYRQDHGTVISCGGEPSGNKHFLWGANEWEEDISDSKLSASASSKIFQQDINRIWLVWLSDCVSHSKISIRQVVSGFIT